MQAELIRQLPMQVRRGPRTQRHTRAHARRSTATGNPASHKPPTVVPFPQAVPPRDPFATDVRMINYPPFACEEKARNHAVVTASSAM